MESRMRERMQLVGGSGGVVGRVVRGGLYLFKASLMRLPIGVGCKPSC